MSVPFIQPITTAGNWHLPYLLASITAWFRGQQIRRLRQKILSEDIAYRQGLREGRAWASGFASKRKLKARG